MIFINGYPAVLDDELENKIVLTDTAESKPSVVYMDKLHAPKPRTLAFVQIANRDFNRALPISDTNRKSSYEFWFWVDQVLSSEFPVNTKYDENGDPILDDDGNIDLGKWRTRPGIVQIILYEHKHVLSRKASLHNVNIINMLPVILNTFNEGQENPYLNYHDWESLANFLSFPEYKVFIDYGRIYYEEDGITPLPSEYPPAIPSHCIWQQLTLTECLEDLLKNYDCRVLSETVTFPYQENYEAENVFTYIKWKKRKKIQYDESLVYENIAWPVNTVETLAVEDQCQIMFPTVGTSVSGSGATLYAGTYYSNPPSDSTPNSELLFICNLHPKLDAFDDLTYTAVTDYIKETHVNFLQYYSFITPHLPSYYYENYEWSTIELVASANYQYYKVDHLPRRNLQPVPVIYDSAFNIVFQGFVKAASSGTVTLDGIADLTNNIVYPGLRILQDSGNTSITQVNGVYLAVGDIATFHIYGEDIILIAINNRDPFEDHYIPPMFDGQEVTAITWTCPGWSFALDDSYFVCPPSPSNALFPQLDYSYVSHEIVGDEGDGFATSRYPRVPNAISHHNFNTPNSSNLAKVTFELAHTLEQIYDYFANNNAYSNWTEAAIQLLVNDWYRRYQFISFYIGFSQSLTSMELYWSTGSPIGGYSGVGIHPDIVPNMFTRSHNVPNSFGETATNLPHTFDSFTYTRPNYLGTTHSGYSTIQAMLYTGYLKRFSELTTTVTLETE
jgi:hypothetical protein